MSEVDRDDDIKIETEEGADIEKENNEEVTIKIPFNPEDIKVKTQAFTLGQLIDMLEHNEIEIYTEFQRHPDLWNYHKKSRFIESVFLNLPIPMFYFDEEDKSLWRVVDGLQRLSTLRHFVIEKDKPLVLQNMEFLQEYEGKTYDELPRSLQRRITSFPITIYLIEKGTPNVVKFNIFSRINQGGLKLTTQEIRHALFQGKAADLVADMVRGVDIRQDNDIVKEVATKEGEAFVQATGGSVPSNRMQDRDFATRFVSFYLVSYEKYQPTLDNFLNKGLEKVKSLPIQEIEKMKVDFKKSMDTAWAIFGEYTFRKRSSLSEVKRNPINKALFEVWSVSLAKLSLEDCQVLIKRNDIVQEKMIRLFHNDVFNKAISYGTAHTDKVKQRFEDIQHIIQETLQHAE